MVYKTIDAANKAVIGKIVTSSPVLLDIVPAKTVIEELNEGKVLLHAGPPIKWGNMTEPMQGSCVGAVLFEEWADTEEEARNLLNEGKVKFIPCHHVNAVGPMGGITSANMPVLVVENTTEGNRAYCTLNEGIGKVLNIAASLIFLKEISPVIVKLDIEEDHKNQVIKFLADTDQFFLNIIMASAKAIMDGARSIQQGTIVTAMCRNGENFGIRIAGMGDEWFTAPVNTPQGLYFAGYDGDMASPDMGDSAITETFGVGGMAMIAAPAVTRFVGTGGFDDALEISNEMREIVIDENPNFIIPTWNFKGICLGIDARKVVEKGITPVINTGIAHKKAGLGQIGAGTVHPPIECFEKAVLAYAKKLGYTE